MDTIKVRMQTSPPGTYTGVLHCTRQTYHEVGLRGFFNGATPALTTSVIENTLVFGANETLKQFIRRQQPDPTKPLSITALSGIGAFAGFFQALFACPAEVVKCRLQVTSGSAPKYTGPFDCVRKIVHESGVKGLYRGFTPFVVREVPFYLVFFGAYEAVCGALQGTTRERSELSVGEVLLAGGVAGCSAWTFVVPADTVKSQLQISNENLGAWATAKHILKTEGVRNGLFRGWTPIMIR